MIDNWLQIIIEIACIVLMLTIFLYNFSLMEILYCFCQKRELGRKTSVILLNKILFSGIYYRILQGRVRHYKESYWTRQVLLVGLFFCATSIIVFIPFVDRFVERPSGGYFFYGFDTHSLFWILLYLTSIPLLVVLLEHLSCDRKVVFHAHSMLNRLGVATLALFFVIMAIVIESKVFSFSKMLEYGFLSNRGYLLVKQPLGAFVFILHILFFYELHLNTQENRYHISSMESSLSGFDFLVYRLSLKLYLILSTMIFIFIFLGGFNSFGLAQMVGGQGWFAINLANFFSLLIKFNIVLVVIYFMRWFFYSYKKIRVVDDNGGKIIILAITNLLIALLLQLL